MKIEFEQIPGKPINLRPMSLVELVKRGLGAKVYVWWAEDNNPLKLHTNDVFTVALASSFSSGVHKGASMGEIRVPCYHLVTGRDAPDGGGQQCR